MDGEEVVNEERARAVAARSEEPIVGLDSERRIVAMSDAAASALGVGTSRRLGEEQAAAHPDLLILFLESPPELPAYQELRAGFTAAVSHELRTPLARLLVLLESATLPGSDVGELMEQARQEVEQARELIDDVLFLGELETGREVVSLGSTRAQPIVEEVVAGYADRADNAQVTIAVRADERVELPMRPRMLRVVLENLLANAIRYAGAGSTCTIAVSESDERSEEHTSELQSHVNLVCRLLLEKKKKKEDEETNIKIIARSTGQDVNSPNVVDVIITTIMATRSRLLIVDKR